MRRLLPFAGILAAVAAGCATSSAVPRPFPGTTVPAPHATTAPVRTHAVVDEAFRYLGTPYADGGSGPSGFDCSGFTRYVFGRASLTLPRDVRDQFKAGRKQRLSQAQPGDLIFFSTIARGASHVGIVVDAGHFIHAPARTGSVRVESFTTHYWRTRLVGVRRVD